jgi:hypothetical protein
MVGNLKTPSARPTRIGTSRFFLLVALFAATFCATTVRAALQFDVFLGYDGTVREASWFPVVCEIKNDGPPFTGVVEVSPGDYGKGQTQQMPVELPTGTVKRLVIPAFAVGRYPSMWNVRLVDERGKLRAEQTALRPRRQIGWEIPLIGSLSRTASGAPVLRRSCAIRPMRNQQRRGCRRPFSGQPARAGRTGFGLSQFRKCGDLRASQVTALLSWMNAGGHLIVGIEQISDITASPWLRGVLPCEPKEIRTVPHHPEIQEWLRTGGPTNAPADSTEPRVAPRNRPMRPGVQRSGPAGTAPVTRSIRAGVSVENPFADSQPDGAFELADLPARPARCAMAASSSRRGDTPTHRHGQSRPGAGDGVDVQSRTRAIQVVEKPSYVLGKTRGSAQDSLRLLRLFSRLWPEFGRNFRRDD